MHLPLTCCCLAQASQLSCYCATACQCKHIPNVQIITQLVSMGFVNGVGLRLTLCGLLTSRSLVRPQSGDMTSQQLGQNKMLMSICLLCVTHGLLTVFCMPGGAGCSCMPQSASSAYFGNREDSSVLLIAQRCRQAVDIFRPQG